MTVDVEDTILLALLGQSPLISAETLTKLGNVIFDLFLKFLKVSAIEIGVDRF